MESTVYINRLTNMLSPNTFQYKNRLQGKFLMQKMALPVTENYIRKVLAELL